MEAHQPSRNWCQRMRIDRFSAWPRFGRLGTNLSTGYVPAFAVDVLIGWISVCLWQPVRRRQSGSEYIKSARNISPVVPLFFLSPLRRWYFRLFLPAWPPPPWSEWNVRAPFPAVFQSITEQKETVPLPKRKKTRVKSVVWQASSARQEGHSLLVFRCTVQLHRRQPACVRHGDPPVRHKRTPRLCRHCWVLGTDCWTRINRACSCIELHTLRTARNARIVLCTFLREWFSVVLKIWPCSVLEAQGSPLPAAAHSRLIILSWILFPATWYLLNTFQIEYVKCNLNVFSSNFDSMV